MPCGRAVPAGFGLSRMFGRAAVGLQDPLGVLSGGAGWTGGSHCRRLSTFPGIATTLLACLVHVGRRRRRRRQLQLPNLTARPFTLPGCSLVHLRSQRCAAAAVPRPCWMSEGAGLPVLSRDGARPARPCYLITGLLTVTRRLCKVRIQRGTAHIVAHMALAKTGHCSASAACHALYDITRLCGPSVSS